MYTPTRIERYNEKVLSKYNIYNSVFMTLPFDSIENTGVLLPLFSEACEAGFKEGLSPQVIIDRFFEKHLDEKSGPARINMMFRFIQYVERQIVLFDAVEDAAFDEINNVQGRGSLRELKDRVESTYNLDHLKEIMKSFRVRTVLTAHPTQFYPGAVLGIIDDLTHALRGNDLTSIKKLLAQLGKTPFIKDEKPTPYDEAVSLIWYMEHVFYPTAGEITQYINKSLFKDEHDMRSILRFGFWPGGDRDGNPFVTSEITLKVADRLRTTILKCYHRDIRNLKRKLTFSGVDILISELETEVYRSVYDADRNKILTIEFLDQKLTQIRNLLIDSHQSLYLEEVDNLRAKLGVFGLHFASLDIRQNSQIHDQAIKQLAIHLPDLFPVGYLEMSTADKLDSISQIKGNINIADVGGEPAISTLQSILSIREIQNRNGSSGSERYIISNCESALHVLETLAFFRLCGEEYPDVDIVPLFEIIDDLKHAEVIIEQLYTHELYSSHLKHRNNVQTVMLGFSDGTKDGGYLMANWSIYKAKERITEMSRRYGISVLFFDGRGGPPARGGGKTHMFYASLGPEIESNEIQITIQGQTISSNFGTLETCRFNLENLITAGAANRLYKAEENKLTNDDKLLLDELSQIGYDCYLSLKEHPLFIPYLERMSTLRYFDQANIGSRPSKRKTSDSLRLSDLRAIPFVGSWSQLKQNVPGFFGVGSALNKFREQGRWQEVVTLYQRSLFFRTLLENSMMSLAKSNFTLTAYMADDPEFGAFWNLINEEAALSCEMLLMLSGQKVLMENYPEGRASILTREHIVIPLLTIQQYALMKIRELETAGRTDDEQLLIYQKLVTRSLFGNTNASRNSA
jgi:phosphoenolpyruvate carboxylase